MLLSNINIWLLQLLCMHISSIDGLPIIHVKLAEYVARASIIIENYPNPPHYSAYFLDSSASSGFSWIILIASNWITRSHATTQVCKHCNFATIFHFHFGCLRHKIPACNRDASFVVMPVSLATYSCVCSIRCENVSKNIFGFSEWRGPGSLSDVVPRCAHADCTLTHFCRFSKSGNTNNKWNFLVWKTGWWLQSHTHHSLKHCRITSTSRVPARLSRATVVSRWRRDTIIAGRLSFAYCNAASNKQPFSQTNAMESTSEHHRLIL